MRRDDFIAAIEREGQAFLLAAGDGDFATRVPCCPDWDLADLVWHLGEVHGFWASVVEPWNIFRPKLSTITWSASCITIPM